jgi:hypothetical protein
MANEKCHFKGNPRKETQGPAYLSLPLHQSTVDDSPTDAGTTPSVSNAATQPPDVATEFSDATLSAASTLA